MSLVIVFVKTDNKVLLLTDQKGAVSANVSSVEDVVGYYERQYNKNHERSYESSMSACIHSLHFQYSVVAFDSEEALRAALPKTGSLFSVRSVAGGVTGLDMGEAGVALWESGAKPRLISPALP